MAVGLIDQKIAFVRVSVPAERGKKGKSVAKIRKPPHARPINKWPNERDRVRSISVVWGDHLHSYHYLASWASII